LKLELGTPVVYCYPIHLNHFLIITRNDKYEPWMYSNYIQLSCPPELPYDRTKILDFFQYDFFDPFYRTSPFLEETRVKRMENSRDITGAYKEALDSGTYLNVFVDDFYVPFRQVHGKIHTPHDLFLFGYSDKEQVFYVMGYDAYGNPKEYAVDYGLLAEAYQGVNVLLQQEPYRDSTWLIDDYRMKYRDADRGLEVSRITYLIKCFLDSASFDEMPGTVCGTAVYGLIKEYYSNYFQSETEFDVRPLHLLCEHKTLMQKRAAFLRKELSLDLREIHSRFALLQQDFLNLRNTFIKRHISGKRLTPGQFQSTLDELAEREAETCRLLLDKLA
jgi:hypothetical protein